MKIYLLNPPYFPHFGRGARWQDTGRGGTLYYPIWLSYAAAALENNHEIKLVDAPAWNWSRDDVLDDIKMFNPQLVVVDSSFPSLNNDINVAESIKQIYDDIKIVFVGPPTSQFPEKILENGIIDFVAKWEYDFTLKEIAEKLETNESFKEIAGISYRDGDKIVHTQPRDFTNSSDLDGIPFVSKIYEKYLNINDYFLGQSLYPQVQIFTGRGCPNGCTFCSWPQTLMGKKYRVRSIQDVLDELEWIEKNLPYVIEVFFEDDTFTIDTKRVVEFTDGYLKRNLKITWSCNARATLDYETMKKMKKSNCRLLIVGNESGNDEILKSISKGITVSDIRNFAKSAKKAGLLVHGDYIIGLPGETKETIENTKNIIKETKPDILQIAVASPFPGTEFYNWCKEGGYLLTDDPNEYLDEHGHQKAIISYPELSNKEMVKEADAILKGYFMSLRYVPLAFRQIMRKHGLDEMRRLWHSTKMFLGYVKER